MAFSVFSNSVQRAYGIKDFIVDTPSDIDQLSTNYTPGCMAFAISNSTYYMLNHQKQWRKINISNTSGGSGSSSGNTPFDPTDIDPNTVIIYDAGEEP